jgi:hypothetical protein
MAFLSTRSAASLGSLSGVLVNSGVDVTPTGPVPSLFGFDVITQFSRHLLQAGMVQSLAGRGLLPLSAFVPWGSIALPPSLLATMSMQFRLSLSVRPARLELRLVDPYIADFHWPISIADPIDGGTEASGAIARIVGQRRSVDIGWRLEINVLTATPGGLATAEPAPSGNPSPSTGATRSPVSPVAVVGPRTVTMGTPSSGSASDANWDRFTLATGTAITTANAQLSVPTGLWCFGMDLDFSEATPTVTSDAAAATDFLATDAGTSMLSQAVAHLRAAVGVSLTPNIAPAGALSAAYVQRMNLPPFHVRDVLLTDTKNDPVLCLCAQVGGATSGVARLVQPFLLNSDFAYGVSTRVLGPALKTWWSIGASGLSITSIVPVELPVDGNSHQTAPGQAQVRISFSNVLDDVAIKAATDSRGDPLRLLSRQTIQLLNLWDPYGKQVTDLGDLAQPEVVPFVMPMCPFASTGAGPNSIQPNVKDFIVRLMAAIFFPLLGSSFSVGSRSITGFTSAALSMFLVRWALKSPLDDVFAPIAGATASMP